MRSETLNLKGRRGGKREGVTKVERWLDLHQRDGYEKAGGHCRPPQVGLGGQIVKELFDAIEEPFLLGLVCC